MVDKREYSLKKENLLSSWKEIASYLDCDVRTCLRWEKDLGLPVQRLGESPRTRVFAYKEELDQWMADRANNNNSAGTDSPSIPKLRIPLGWRITILAAIVLASAIAIYLISSADPQPADFKIQGSELIITNITGQELFRHDTGLEDLMPEEYYRDHFQVKKRDLEIESFRYNYPQLIIKDIDADGDREVLFSPQTQSEKNEEKLLCLNCRGEVIWSYKTGRRLTFGERVYADHYRICNIWVKKFADTPDFRIFVVSIHNQDFPTQIVMLDSKGERLGEYWNSGRLMDLCFADLDRDGREEILVGGMNNEYKAPCLIVFDQDLMKGSSPQKDLFFKCKELEEGQELFHVLFPVEEEVIFPLVMESISLLELKENKTIEAMAKQSYTEYYFGFDFIIRNIRLPHRYQIYYRLKVDEGRITEPFDHNRIAARLKKEIRYWDGDEWVSTPTTTKYWRNRQ